MRSSAVERGSGLDLRPLSRIRHRKCGGYPSLALPLRCPVPAVGFRLGTRDLIAVLWDDLVLRNAPNLTAGVYAGTVGTAPFRVFAISYENADHFGGLTIDSFDFQVRLFETTNRVEMQYGPGNPEHGSDSTTGINNGPFPVGPFSTALGYACDTNNSLPDGLTVRFFRPRVSIDVAGSGSGQVVTSPSGARCAGDCETFFDASTSPTLTAFAAEGSTFTGWSGACTGAGPCALGTLDGDKSVTATFDAPPAPPPPPPPPPVTITVPGPTTTVPVASPADTRGPTLKLAKLATRVAQTTFRRGVTVQVTPSEPVTLDVALAVPTRTATIAATSFPLTLADTTTRLTTTAARTLQLKPNAKLLGKPKKTFNAQLKLVATDRAGNRTTTTRTITVAPDKKAKRKKR